MSTKLTPGLVNYFLGFVILFHIASCKKGEVSPPGISIQSPNANQKYAFNDTVVIQGSITDKQEVLYYDIYLLTESGDTVKTIQKKYLFEPEAQISQSLVFDGINLFEGEFDLHIRGIGSQSTTSLVIPIQLGNAVGGSNGSRYTVIVASEGNASNSTDIDFYSLNGAHQKSQTVAGDLVQGAVLGNQYFFTLRSSGRYDLYRMDLNTYELSLVTSRSNDRSTLLTNQNNKMYVGWSNGDIEAYNESGVSVFNLSLSSGEQAKALHDNGERIYVHIGHPSFSSTYIAYYDASGNHINNIIGVSDNVAGITSYTNTKQIYYFSKNTSVSYCLILLHDYQNNLHQSVQQRSGSWHGMTHLANRSIVSTSYEGIVSFTENEQIETFNDDSRFNNSDLMDSDGSNYLVVASRFEEIFVFRIDSRQQVMRLDNHDDLRDLHLVFVR